MLGKQLGLSRPTAATLLSLSGGDASWTLVDQGLPVERMPDAIARTVELVVDDLRKKGRK